MWFAFQPFLYDYQDEEDEDKQTVEKKEEANGANNSSSSKGVPNDDEDEESNEDKDSDRDYSKPRSEPLLSKIPLTQKFIMCPKDFKDGYLMELLRSIRDDEVKLPVKVRSMILFAATIR